MPKAYILGAKIPSGGTYMAYHVGVILARRFGYTPVDVHVSRDAAPELFTYPMVMQSVPVRKMEREINEGDMLIANASFSDFFFGRRLPCQKIMYAQGFNTFTALDCGFDAYVAVSTTVQTYLRAMFDITAPVIPAFVDVASVPKLLPWKERQQGSALVYLKQPDLGHHVVYQTLKDALPNLPLANVYEGRKVSHAEFLSRIASVRYLINISLGEGFGLPALEAMALGTCVVGLDGMGGADFMRPGENCLTTTLQNIANLPEIVSEAFAERTLAERCAQEGVKTAARYGYAQFEKAWVEMLAGFLKAPHAG